MSTNEYIFSGTVELSGVTFFVDAENAKEAMEKARAGEYREYETTGAETIDWELYPDTCQLNGEGQS